MIPLIAYILVFLLVILACFQDFKRREIDHWVNILIFVVGFIGLIVSYFNHPEAGLIYSFIIILLVNVLISQVFYKTRLMGGGDCDLLLALTPLLASTQIIMSLLNLGKFVFFVLLAGSIYGLAYILFTYLKNFKIINKKIKHQLNLKKIIIYLIPIILLVVLSFLDNLFIFLTIIFIIYPPLYLLSKVLDGQLMKRKILGKEIEEGDILTKDVKYNGKIFYSNKPLSKQEVKCISKKNTVEIKDGIPFAPSFLLAIIIYFLLKIGLITFF